ncbi:MAG: Ldh family oxidoreductase [Desulfobacterales bacterium]|nr:Ldh family oxidoreductase [Deltaproteobacteria bacterium]NNK95773.1 Ldh family oxidoreductase [Desulfobacterales bacterium]
MVLEQFKVQETDLIRIREEDLRRTVAEIFKKMGLSTHDSDQGADVLVMADLRGVESHGVSNTLRSYVKDYENGSLNPATGYQLLRETPGTAVIDAERRLGIVVGAQAMALAIEKAAQVGVGVVTVRNSGHLGAVGYYTMMAAKKNMVGVCFGCSGMPTPSVVPTFASSPMFGTNPISIAAPARKEAPFLFDIATSAISGNKVRLAVRLQTPLLPGWVADQKGQPLAEETLVFDRNQFSLLPLGGTREHGSHKGYGLAMMTEILAAILSGSIPIMLDNLSGAKGHFAAYDISAFTDIEAFKDQMDQMLEHLRSAPPAEGHERVLYPGLLEHEEEGQRRINGIPLHREVIDWFDSITKELGIDPLRVLS